MFTYCLNNPVNNSDPGGDIATGGVGLMIGLVIGLVNNVINTIYFEYSDGKSELSSDSYRDESVTRWDKLDYAKQQTGEDHYNINAWRYYSEYTVHEYGWYVTSSAYEKDIPVVSSLADRFATADIYPQAWDERWYVNVATFIFGLIGF